MTSLQQPIPVTAPRGDGDQLLYFTSPSLTADDRHLVFIRTEDGNPNLVTRDLHTGEERQLTHNRDGWLRSYVYFDGHPYKGFGKASVSMDPASGRIFYIQGRDIRCVSLSGEDRVLATPDTQDVTAFTHVSSDGRWLCVPTSDRRTLDGPFPGNKPGYDVDARVQSEGLGTRLRIYDTQTGELASRQEIRPAWITHVQFCPTDPEVLLFNNEWPSECGVRRMWLKDDIAHWPVRTALDGRCKDDWICHEMWSRDGSTIIYHGKIAAGCFVGRFTTKPGVTHRFNELTFHPEFTRYGHFTVGNGDWLVTDGYYQQADDPEPPGWGGQWIALLKPDWQTGEIEWRPVCRHGSSWKQQDDHPHPVFNHAGDAVFFTSDVTGLRNIYRVDAPC